jgi:RNA polymerase sigma factor (sigma-70 family)
MESIAAFDYHQRPPCLFDADILLFSDIADGNAESFEKFYNGSRGSIFSFCFRAVRNKEIADELVQSAFVKLWLNRRHLKSVLHPNAYMKKLASNLIVDYFLALKKNRYSEINEYAINICFCEDIEEVQDKKNKMNLIYEAVKALPDQQRNVFVMSKLEGRRYKEIADTFNVTVSAVNFNLVEALKKVRAYVKGKS